MGALRQLLLVLVAVSATVATAAAQTVEVAPFVGYRFGGDFYEVATGESVDLDGARSLGVVGDVRLGGDLWLEALYTHQEARFASRDDPAGRFEVTVDHFHVGGLRELGWGRVRPFLTGTVGLTRYGIEEDDEIRFSLAAGGGVKLYPARRVAIRLDGRFFATIVDADGDELFCRPGRCIGAVDVSVLWQAEFTAGLVVGF